MAIEEHDSAQNTLNRTQRSGHDRVEAAISAADLPVIDIPWMAQRVVRSMAPADQSADIVLLLNRRHRLVSWLATEPGHAEEAAVLRAQRIRAPFAIYAHWRHRGRARISRFDHALAARMRRALSEYGTVVEDHQVVTPSGYESAHEERIAAAAEAVDEHDQASERT